MTKREKVVKGLECCSDAVLECGENCPYWNIENCQSSMQDDALALLKAQDPRVMSFEEAKSTYVIEYRSGKMREIGSALLDISVDPLNIKYGKIYRVWTSRPTDEQREKVKWE